MRNVMNYEIQKKKKKGWRNTSKPLSHLAACLPGVTAWFFSTS